MGSYFERTYDLLVYRLNISRDELFDWDHRTRFSLEDL
jgi:hypothetical protein